LSLGAIEKMSLEEAVTSILTRLVEVDSANPPGKEPALAEALEPFLGDLGMSIELDPVIGERSNLHAWLGRPEGGVAFVSHLDTVPAGDGWNSDPFAPVVRGDVFTALGASDPKASIAAYIVALNRLVAAGWRPRGSVRFVGLVDEEERQTGAQAWVETKDSSAFPDFAMVGEPTGLQVVTCHKGEFYLEVRFDGAEAHSSEPSAGANAIYAAADLISYVESLQAAPPREGGPEHPLTGFGTWSVGTARGGRGITIVPETAVVQIDCRFNPNDDPHRSVDLIRSAAEQIAGRRESITASVQVLHLAPAMETDPEIPAVRTLVEAAGEEITNPGPIGWGATCDANLISSAGVPVVVFGPGDLVGSAHKPNESVRLREVAAAARIFESAIPRLDGLLNS
jgi:acetylornithine deacetylase/succinyl-diaminopimelate desuccinylase-like protein